MEPEIFLVVHFLGFYYPAHKTLYEWKEPYLDEDIADVEGRVERGENHRCHYGETGGAGGHRGVEMGQVANHGEEGLQKQ